MGQHYSNPERANDPHALPDVETFYVRRGTLADCLNDHHAESPAAQLAFHDDVCIGWYWHACFPGCLPDGEPNGPFQSEAEAVADAQEDAWQDDDDRTLWCSWCGTRPVAECIADPCSARRLLAKDGRS